MIAGDPMLKTNANGKSICHRCLGNGEGFAPCDSKDSAELPLKYCPKGIRVTVIFPSCWDGKNLDSPVRLSLVLPPHRPISKEKKAKGKARERKGDGDPDVDKQLTTPPRTTNPT